MGIAGWTRGRIARVVGVAVLAWLAAAGVAHAQLGALISPGRLSRPHAELEGISQCQSCHERGQRVTAQKCLTCHEPVATRITRQFGVHAAVKGDCVACHVEHAGVEGELRPFDTRRFDHTTVTGFPLDGRHAGLPGDCAACHKERSFLTTSPACASCHEDVHKGTLGQTCTGCHTTTTPFTQLSPAFSHATTRFPLRGAHADVACASCHAKQAYRGIAFSSCTSCHRDPHRPAQGADCASCHTETSWRTERIDHARTNFPLRGGHVEVACAACHTQPASRVKPAAETCASCHTDVHRGSFPGQDCAACHTETTFQGSPFDHTRTAFPLTGAHGPLACAACHTTTAPLLTSRPRPMVVDFRGLRSACVSCHVDTHGGELGSSCESCHSTTSFDLERYTHARVPEFFGGQHAAVACEGCHVPAAPTRPVRDVASLLAVRFTAASTACVSCHRDVHLGQEGSECQACHDIDTADFAIDDFAHETTSYPLTGRHATTACEGCHKQETADFPAGRGTAVRLKGLGRECRACHVDVHLGQLEQACESCHSTSTFDVEGYRHRGPSLGEFFVGSHLRADCVRCHAPATAAFPSGAGTAVRFQVERQCVACHEDRHRGSLGTRCAECHRP